MHRTRLKLIFAQDTVPGVTWVRTAGDDVYVLGHSSQTGGLHRIGTHQQIVVVNRTRVELLVRDAPLIRSTIDYDLRPVLLEESNCLIQEAQIRTGSTTARYCICTQAA